MKYVYGPVPSRRLGQSLGISPIPKKYCNYSCIYCQLGRTDHMTNRRQMFFPVQAIIDEFDEAINKGLEYDVVTIVGEGEPTLYLGLGDLICEIKKRTERPIAVITNGALLSERAVREELKKADIVLPTFDAYDEESFKKINRPVGSIHYIQVADGLKTFSAEYDGQLWIEIMLIADVNDDHKSLRRYAEILAAFRHDKVYINTPVRPPAESDVHSVSSEKMSRAVNILQGIPINLLESEGFYSEITDHYEAIMSIIRRHPMNQFEIEGFLKARDCNDTLSIMKVLDKDTHVEVVDYKGYFTYRLK